MNHDKTKSSFSITRARMRVSKRCLPIRWLGCMWLLLVACSSQASTSSDAITLYESFAGNISYVAVGNTMRTASNTAGGACSFGTSSSATVELPSNAGSIRRAYLFWAASADDTVADNGDLSASPIYGLNQVRFQHASGTSTITADEVYRVTDAVLANLDFYGAFADVTGLISSSTSQTYTLSELDYDNSFPSSACAGGWSLLVVYDDDQEKNRVINIFTGLQDFQNSSIQLVPRNFLIDTAGGADGQISHISFEGDEDLSGGAGSSEDLSLEAPPGGGAPTGVLANFFQNLGGGFWAVYDGVTGSGQNILNSQYDSTVMRPTYTYNGSDYEFDTYVYDRDPDNASGPNEGAWGVDVDTYYIHPDYLDLFAGASELTSRYRAGQDLVLLLSEIITVANVTVADLEIDHGTTGAGKFLLGQAVDYSVAVANFNGPSVAAGTVRVFNRNGIPAGLNAVVPASVNGWDCSATSLPIIDCSYNITNNESDGDLDVGDTLPDLVFSLTATAPFSSTSFEVEFDLDLSAAEDTDGNTLYDNVNSRVVGEDIYTGSPEEVPSNVNNNYQRVVTELAVADLSVSKTHIGDFSVGINGFYNVTVTNNGTDSHNGIDVTITDTLPAGLSYVSENSTNWNCTPGSPVVCNYTGVAVSNGADFETLEVEVAVAGAAATASPVVNNVTVNSGTAGTPDLNGANDTDSDSTNVIGAADLSVVKVHSADFYTGSTGSFQITVTNNGPNIASAGGSPAVQIVDTLDGSFSFDSFTASDWSCAAIGQVLTCNYTGADIASGVDFQLLDINVDVAAGITGSPSIDNTATVSIGSNNVDNNVANNSDTDSVTILEQADLQLGLAISSPVLLEEVEETIDLTVTNNGSIGATGTVRVYARLDAGFSGFAESELELTSLPAGTGWDCSASSIVSQLVDCSLSIAGSLANGGDAEVISFNVKIPSSAAFVGGVINTEIAFDIDCSNINEFDSVNQRGGGGACTDAPIETPSDVNNNYLRQSVTGQQGAINNPDATLGNKPLYIQNPGSNSNVPVANLETSRNIFAGANNNRVRLNGLGITQTWLMNAGEAITQDIELSNADFDIRMIMRRNNPGSTRTLLFNLSYVNGGGTTTIAQQSFTEAVPTAFSVEVFTIAAGNIVDANIPAGSQIQLSITNNSTAANQRILLRPNPTTANQKAAIGLNSNTVLSVDSVQFFDAAFPSGVQVTVTNPDDAVTLFVRTEISDPFGSFDINTTTSPPTLQLFDGSGSAVALAGAFTQVDDDGARLVYETSFVVPSAVSSNEVWAALVNADEGSEGFVSAVGIGNLSVVVPVPEVLIAILVRNVNQGGLFANTADGDPGETLEYQITLTTPVTSADAQTVQVSSHVPRYTTVITSGLVFASYSIGGAGAGSISSAQDSENNNEVSGHVSGTDVKFFVGTGQDGASGSQTGGIVIPNSTVTLTYQVNIE